MSEPSVRELLGWFTPEFLPHQDREEALAAASTLAARVEAVLALHAIGDVGLPPSAKPRCGSCREHWPCPTRRILDGGKP